MRDLVLTVHDIVFDGDQYRDWLMITGHGAGVTYTPSLSTSFGNDNRVGPRGATGSTLTLGGRLAANSSFTIRFRARVG